MSNKIRWNHFWTFSMINMSKYRSELSVFVKGHGNFLANEEMGWKRFELRKKSKQIEVFAVFVAVDEVFRLFVLRFFQPLLCFTGSLALQKEGREGGMEKNGMPRQREWRGISEKTLEWRAETQRGLCRNWTEQNDSKSIQRTIWGEDVDQEREAYKRISILCNSAEYQRYGLLVKFHGQRSIKLGES